MALGYPYDTVVRITDVLGGQSVQGSGVLISPDEVLTASHLVWSSDYGPAINVDVAPGFDQSGAPYGSAFGTTVHYNPISDSGDIISEQQSQSDFAVIHLATSFSVGTMALQPAYGGGTVQITGYPGAADGIQVSHPILVAVDPNYALLDGFSLGPGSSGGPLWIEQNGVPTVVGLVSAGNAAYYGYDVALTAADVNQINAWVSQDDGTPLPPAVPVTLNVKQAHNASNIGTGPHAILQFHGARADYSIGFNAFGWATVTDNAGGLARDGTAVSVNNEVLQFTDQPYFIEDADGATIARLYSAGLGRLPDPAGQFGWEDLYRTNVADSAKAQGVYVGLAETSGGFNGSLSIADGIIDSPEFIAKYGPLSNSDFVTTLYQNVLGRGPDPAGLSGWLDYMTPGNASGMTFTRGMVLVGFAESPENIADAGAWLSVQPRFP